MEVISAIVNQEKPANSNDQSVDQPVIARQRENARMFDRIAHRYDFLNRLLSLRRDVVWRRRLVDHLPAGSQLHLLDVATGTADLILSLKQHSEQIGLGIGLDLAPLMLEVGGKKLRGNQRKEQVALVLGDGAVMPFPADSFDVVTIGFGIRNFADTMAGLCEFHRVLRPGGRLLVLEFSLPRNRLLYYSYLAYFRYFLPIVGRLLSGDAAAYRHLNRSVESFPHGREFCDLLEKNGFTNVRATPLTFGVASIYQGDKTS
ncbi:MAG: ubiquinone/menaquinone biosynthesis methyltransferase [candidate division Zixibacteria bacterium]|nr:ubiquinone/menaquinone biosynthesis methyltransferase [candidate division Zixibacteria bacterium]MDH3937321.1 ubiquinone/menaquinone biosynthesis methyltransferase [candidate division Zixibacteria bacterium]MDH4033655.1 ubiquinone/menaquinone biosynthesis methyltransferase [candidate division Zixibacteria bacterium]